MLVGMIFSGTFKYIPTVVHLSEFGASNEGPVRYNSITCMESYKGKSFEELRFEDYKMKHNSPGMINTSGIALMDREQLNCQQSLFAKTTPSAWGSTSNALAFPLQSSTTLPSAWGSTSNASAFSVQSRTTIPPVWRSTSNPSTFPLQPSTTIQSAWGPASNTSAFPLQSSTVIPSAWESSSNASAFCLQPSTAISSAWGSSSIASVFHLQSSTAKPYEMVFSIGKNYGSIKIGFGENRANYMAHSNQDERNFTGGGFNLRARLPGPTFGISFGQPHHTYRANSVAHSNQNERSVTVGGINFGERLSESVNLNTASAPADISLPSPSGLPLCAICLSNEREYLFEPCGHLVACGNCAGGVRNTCPICRRWITKKVKAYIS